METVTCTGCSLLCDDIKVVVENGRIVKNFGCCTVGTEKINLLSSPERLTNPKVQGLNQSLPVEEMAEKVAEMLKASRCPLLYGWCNSTCEAIGLGLKMAEKLGGVFDSPLSLYHGYAIMHAKKLGAYKVTLDDVREEADHIIFWGANPAETFHRHMSKFSVFPRGERVERGVESRILTVIDVRKTRTVAHNKLVIKPREDLALIKALTETVSGGKLSEPLSLPYRKILSLTQDLKNSRFVAIFYGLGLLGTGMAEANLEALGRLMEALGKAGVKCVVMPLPGHYNSLGFVETALREAGYPYAIDYSEGAARHNPTETSAIASLLKGKVDSALIVGSNPLSSLPGEAAERLSRLPIAALDHVENLTVAFAGLKVPTAISGFETGGTVHRLDNKPLQLKPAVKPPEGILSDEEFLRKVYENL